MKLNGIIKELHNASSRLSPPILSRVSPLPKLRNSKGLSSLKYLSQIRMLSRSPVLSRNTKGKSSAKLLANALLEKSEEMKRSNQNSSTSLAIKQKLSTVHNTSQKDLNLSEETPLISIVTEQPNHVRKPVIGKEDRIPMKSALSHTRFFMSVVKPINRQAIKTKQSRVFKAVQLISRLNKYNKSKPKNKLAHMIVSTPNLDIARSNQLGIQFFRNQILKTTREF